MRVSSNELFSTLKNVTVHTILPPSPVILWIELGGKPKWLPLNFGYHDVMRTGTITSARNSCARTLCAKILVG